MEAAEQPGSDVNKARVLLVEDHAVVRHELAMLIGDEPDLSVCGGAGTAAEALAAVRKLKPDVVVIDISLGNDSGLDLIKQVRELHPGLPILALSMHDEAVYAERAVRAGAKGYVMKKEATDLVLTAIRRVLAGEVYLSERMASRMLRKLVHPGGALEDASPVESLSAREFEVFNLIARGVGPSEIAQRLGLSVKTIETHREHIKEKLGLKDRAELTRYALQWITDHG
jgi:DNA-binding NarL/FixJ family response regulator